MTLRRLIRSALRKLFQNLVEVYLSTIPDSPSHPKNVERILVFAYHGLGNFVMFTPALRLLRETFPAARIDLQVGNNTGCEEVLDGAGYFDTVYNLPYNAGLRAWIRRLVEVRRAGYHVTVNEFHSHSWPLALLVAASRAPIRVGHVTSPGWAPEFSRYSFAFNVKVAMRDAEHEIERYLDLVAAIGAQKPDYQSASTQIHLTDTDRAFARSFLDNPDTTDGSGLKKPRDGTATSRIVGFQPGTSATMRWKQWPVERWRAVIEQLVSEPASTRVVLFGSGAEAPMIEEMARGLGSPVLIAAGKTSIKQAAALIESCDVLVCNDSGLMHIAGAVGTPVVAIYGPTDLRRTRLLGASNTIVRHELPCSPCFTMEGEAKVLACPHHDCLMTIQPEEVIVAIQSTTGRKVQSAP
jgi:heptosyltransferase-2